MNTVFLTTDNTIVKKSIIDKLIYCIFSSSLILFNITLPLLPVANFTIFSPPCSYFLVIYTFFSTKQQYDIIMQKALIILEQVKG